MIRIVLLCILISSSLHGSAQRLNMLKTNLLGLAVRNFNLTYERGITKKTSFAISGRYMPSGKVPFMSYAEDLLSYDYGEIDRLSIGNMAITGELRFYLGKKSLSGFYISPCVRYTRFDLDLPVEYPVSNGTSPNENILFKGSLTAISAGLYFGVQANLSKSIVLDIWLLGGHYGKSNGILTATNINPELSPEEQETLQNTIDDIDDLGPFKIEGSVISSTSAEIRSEGPWLGYKGFGLGLGFRF